ncbi:hypothetical protein OIO90_005519 [Microbotryomycetes sp. JL221]|nr:hypothetical protein OIO90_005519 [Microbotryomycetes sp. JL221]
MRRRDAWRYASVLACLFVTTTALGSSGAELNQRALDKRRLVARQRLTTTTTTAGNDSPTTTATTTIDVVTTSSTAAAASTTTTTTTAAASTTTSAQPPSSSTTTTTVAPVPTTTTTATTSEAETLSTEPETTTTTPRLTVESAVVVTITSLRTNSDGSTRTMTSESSSMLVPSSGASNSSSSSTGRTWGIVGGSVGGAVLLAAAIYVFYRCTQRRFSDLDHDGDIKWPELQPDGQEVTSGLTTINPQKTRRTGGAGIMGDDDDEDDEAYDDSWEEKHATMGSQQHLPHGAALVTGTRGNRPQSQLDAPYGEYYDPYAAGSQQRFYDPYSPRQDPPIQSYPPSPARSPFQPYSDSFHHGGQDTSTVASVVGSARTPPPPHLPLPGELDQRRSEMYHDGDAYEDLAQAAYSVPIRAITPSNNLVGGGEFPNQNDAGTRPQRLPSPVGLLGQRSSMVGAGEMSRPGSISMDYGDRHSPNWR